MGSLFRDLPQNQHQNQPPKLPSTFPQPIKPANPHSIPTSPQPFPQPKSKSPTPSPSQHYYGFPKYSPPKLLRFSEIVFNSSKTLSKTTILEYILNHTITSQSPTLPLSKFLPISILKRQLALKSPQSSRIKRYNRGILKPYCRCPAQRQPRTKGGVPLNYARSKSRLREQIPQTQTPMFPN